jgi:hypothetical protein
MGVHALQNSLSGWLQDVRSIAVSQHSPLSGAHCKQKSLLQL